jgi:hypothetical protein
LSYIQDDDATEIKEIRDKLEKLQSDFLSTQFSASQENIDSGSNIIPAANPVSRGGGSGSGGGGGGVNYPLRYPLSAHGTIGLVTESFSWNFHGHTATLSGDISVAFTNLPPVGVGQDIKLRLIHDNVGTENRVVTFPTEVTNLDSISIPPNSDAIIVLTTDNGGVSYHAYSESGIVSTGSSDNLGNHIMTQDLQGGLNDIVNLKNLDFKSHLELGISIT